MKIFYYISLLFLVCNLYPQNKVVYVVLGSDTGIWDGMNTNQYVCTYNSVLYNSPLNNPAKVMNPNFRSNLVDSYGGKLKLTWWIMGGNLFRYATNTDVPIPNIMTLYLMKHYYKQQIQIDKDEITLHYHDWIWSDYNHDGSFMWNQAPRFLDSKEDFDFTLCQFLLEENTFPVSFRSGWHAMDNTWQNYLNQLLPYSLHNDYPSKHIDTLPPIDNVYDWSKCSSEFVPFHPSDTNYQKKGNLATYNTRSIYMASMSQNTMNNVFQKAKDGTDQLVTLWAHVPESDFTDNIRRIDSILHVSANQFPDVKFKYCTATEAYYYWRNLSDNTPPLVSVQEIESNGKVKYQMTTSEKIFQKAPYVAVKTINEDYYKLNAHQISANTFITDSAVTKDLIAKIGFSVCDTSANQTNKIIKYLPDDFFIATDSNGYHEVKGNWSTISNERAWDSKYRKSSSDTASFYFDVNVEKNTLCNFFCQPFEDVSVPVTIKLLENNIQIDSINISSLKAKSWNFLLQKHLDSAKFYKLMVEKKGTGNINFNVLKISALISDYRLVKNSEHFVLPEMIIDKDYNFNITIKNIGRKVINFDRFISNSGVVKIDTLLPISISQGEEKTIKLKIKGLSLGAELDTVRLFNGTNEFYRADFLFNFQNYFQIVDNEDSLLYSETGAWSTSNAQAFGHSSRYSSLGSGIGGTATYTTTLDKEGIYDVFEIVPTTSNASIARYSLFINSVLVDTITIDQNVGSGAWRKLLTHNLPAQTPIQIKVVYPITTATNFVLRADAIKFQIADNTSGIKDINSIADYKLQNYPNPFNPSTKIRVGIKKAGMYNLEVFDILGRRIRVLFNGTLQKGSYEFNFNTDKNFSNGVYIYRLTGEGISLSSKMMLLK